MSKYYKQTNLLTVISFNACHWLIIS